MRSQKSEDRSQKEEGRGKWVPVVVAVVTLVAMGRLCGMEFTWWDDNLTIHHNPMFNPATWGTVRYYWTHAYMGLYVPVTYMVWAGLAAIAWVPVADERGISMNPWVFHTANVLVHVINALVVYGILKLIVKRPWAAGAGALVFGVHPVQVETVGWVSGMKDLLCGTFVLLAVWQYLLHCGLRMADCGMEAGRRRWHVGIALACTAVATLCKPTAVVVPVLLAVLDLWVVGRDWRRVARGVWPFAVVVLPCVVWAKAVQSVGARGPVWSRPLVAGDAVAFYFWKLVWPMRLAVDYGRNPRWVIGSGAIWWTWVIAAAVALAAWVGRRRAGVVWAGLAVFVAGMLPVLGLTPFMFQRYSTVADHYLYLPMLGVGMVVAWGVARLPARGVGVAAGVIVAAMVVRSVVQAGVWADDESLDLHTIAVNPRSSVAHVNLAAALEYRGRQQGSDALVDEAVGHLQEAIRLNPEEILARQNLSVIMIKRGNVDEAIRLLLDAIAVADHAPPEEREKLAPSHRALAAVLAKRGRLEEAAREYRAAREYEPGNREIEKELAAVEEKRRQKSEDGSQTK